MFEVYCILTLKHNFKYSGRMMVSFGVSSINYLDLELNSKRVLVGLNFTYLEL